LTSPAYQEIPHLHETNVSLSCSLHDGKVKIISLYKLHVKGGQPFCRWVSKWLQVLWQAAILNIILS